MTTTQGHFYLTGIPETVLNKLTDLGVGSVSGTSSTFAPYFN